MSENAKQGRVVISPGLNILYTHVESKELSLVMTMKGVQISMKDLLLSMNKRRLPSI